jgi:tetratricopeptide (TPR) repeat protein
MLLRAAARRLIEVDPYNETGHRMLMRLFAEDGERAQVREVYVNLQHRLRDDLGVEPDSTTAELYRALLPTGLPPLPAFPAPRREAERLREAAEAESLSQLVQQKLSAAASDKAGVPKVTVLPPPPVPELSYHHHIAVSLVEDIAIGLCRFRGLTSVAPHTSAELSYGGKKALFQSFGIDYAVETQLQDRGGEVWLSVKLLHAPTRKILWAEQYAFNRESIARQYRELSVRIAVHLMDRIEREELAHYETEQDPTAYHLFLRGQRYLRALDLPNVRRARREFKAAVGACKDFVPAIASLARTYQREWLLMARGDRDLLAESERLARIAIDLDPDDARGYRELGNCTLFVGRFDESLRAFELAEQRNPQHADLLADLADALSHACEPAAALQKIEKAIELNPLCPDHYWWAAGGANFHLRRYGDAIACMSRMRDQSPAYRLLAASSAMLGERERAAEYVQKTKDIHPDFSVNGWLSILPIRDSEYAQHYAQGLREAGFA